MSPLKLHIFRHSEPYCVATVAADSEIDWDRTGAAFFSVSHTATETSIICPASAVPDGVRNEGPFELFEVAGPLDFALVGILASILDPLAAKGLTVLSLSTYETDWILVPADRADEAERIWRREGFLVTPAVLGSSS